MRVQLKALFILVAIAAAISAWLVQRRTPFYSALIQVVDSIPPTGRTPDRKSDRDSYLEKNFESTFYALLIDTLAAEHPEIAVGPDPQKRIREVIRLELMSDVPRTSLYAVQAWANVVTSDREELKTIMKTTVKVLNTLSQDQSRESKTKILSVPAL